MKIDSRQHVLQCAVDADEALFLCQLDAAQYVGRIDGGEYELHAAGQRHRPDPFGELALLNVKDRVGECPNVAEMIEMRMRDEDGVDVTRRDSDLGHHHLRRLPGGDAETVGVCLGEVPV